MALNSLLRPFSRLSSCACRQATNAQRQSLRQPSSSLLSNSSRLPALRIHARFITQPGAQLNTTLHDEIKKNTERASSRSVEDIWLGLSKNALSEVKYNPPADAYSGRSVKIPRGGLAEGYRILDTILGRNKVRAQLRRAERHEKKGVKRRRLSSERWRKQFANEVRKKVELVIKIRNRGA